MTTRNGLGFALLAALLLAPATTSAKKFADKVSVCESVRVTAAASTVVNGVAAASFSETLTRSNSEKSRLQLYVDRETGSVRGAKVIRDLAGGTRDITSIPILVIVEYNKCRTNSDNTNGIVIEYYDATDFLP